MQYIPRTPKITVQILMLSSIENSMKAFKGKLESRQRRNEMFDESQVSEYWLYKTLMY